MMDSIRKKENDMTEAGALFVCATPIGNLEDISLRVLRILKEVDVIAAEDTRHTRKLLNYYDIHTPLTSCHEHNEQEKGRKIIEQIKAGKSVALVSDAGTPGISDPGTKVIGMALEEGLKVVPLPGPSAVVTALTVSGLPTDRFSFEGFLPREKKERGQLLAEIKSERRTLIFYEAPHRLLKTLAELHERLGDRKAAVIRELTKLHEEVVRGTLAEVLEHFRNKAPKGEFVIVLEGGAEEKKEPLERSPQLLYESVIELVNEGLDKKSAIKEAATKLGVPKKEVYAAVLEAENK